MAADLTLPGDIPGLLRRGSPVIVVDIEEATTACDGERLSVGDQAVVTDAPFGSRQWCIATGETRDDMGPAWSELPVSGVALDLTDDTARFHVVRWLDAACDRAGTWSPPGRLVQDTEGRPCFLLRGQWTGWVPRRLPIESAAYVCPSLADLDPNDDRRLPDGSRWVDAEALRRVVLNVAGRAQ